MGISPLYSIHQYSEEIYKVVAFKGVRDPENPRVRDQEHEQHYDAKLNEAFCRAKSLVLQYALCNSWECSVCHEQYKSSDGTIPPGGGSGTDPGGEEGETIWDKLGNLLGTIGKGILGMIEVVKPSALAAASAAEGENRFRRSCLPSG